MNQVNYIHSTSLAGLYLLDRPTYPDNRGFFREVFHLNELENEIGHAFQPIQWNHSRSFPRVIRALHAENWNKLVYPVSGEIFIAIADIRPDSKTFGKFETFLINDLNRKALFVSKGLANSICVSGSNPVDYMYLVDAYYDGTDTQAIAWNDPDLQIPWPIKDPIISERDSKNPTLRNLYPQKFPM